MSTPVKPTEADVSADGKPIPQPTLPEAYFMLNIIRFINGKLDTDWTKVAEAQGLKNAETAKVRFGQIKKKLNFASATPASVRARAPKRAAAADTDEPGSTPAEKKPRKAPARSRAKKQQPVASSSSAPASSPTAAEDESPLAAKSAKTAYHHNTGPFSSGLNEGNSYAASAATVCSGSGYTAATSGTDSTATMAVDTPSKTIVKPEPSDSSDDEEESSGRTKASIMAQITQEQMRSEPTGPASQPLRGRHPLPSAAPSAFGPPNSFPQVNMLAPLNAQQVQATAVRNQRQPGQSQGQSARQIRNAAAQQAIASTQSQGYDIAPSTTTGLTRGGGGGEGGVTTIQAPQHHATHHATQHAPGSGNGSNNRATTHGAAIAEKQSHDGLTSDNAHHDEDDGGYSAFNEAMYGVGNGSGDFFDWGAI